ncbi:hypothetical protein WJX72_010040 [[Myrmecia] bisecta]|uniref:RRM domain-containing protein n=1 Tax=[Myrmecia] bisecta TaxID=41462 RepID=A0AAW1PXI1_9CHLO
MSLQLATSAEGITDAASVADLNAKTLWMGDLAYWMDESFIYNLFVGTGQLAQVKIIRNKTTGISEGYGFVEFTNHEAADGVLRTYNGCPIPSTDQVFRLNWAAFGVGKSLAEGQAAGGAPVATGGATIDHSVFVGDLANDVTDYVLQEHFRQFFPSVRSAKVITDPLSGRSKGYGFVRFGSEPERDRALTEMNGHFISQRPIRVSLATAKKTTAMPGSSALAVAQGNAPHPGDYDPTNTTLFIGGLGAGVTEDDLKTIFGRYGEIIYTKIPPGKGCGFVQFVQRHAAEAAMAQMNGQVLGTSTCRISWGRSNVNRPPVAASAGAAFASPYGGLSSASALAALAAYPGTSYTGGYVDPNPLAAYGYSAAAAPVAPAAAVDPYAAYYASLVQQSSPSPLQAYQQQAGTTAALGGYGAIGQNPNSASLALASAAATATAKPSLYDPLAAIDIDRMNAAFIQKHQAHLLGSHLRA